MTIRAGKPGMLREHNERVVFDAIRTGHPISRAEVARRLGLSKPTVSTMLVNLLEAGLVREVAPESGSRTYGAIFFEPLPEAAYVLGLDIGGRFLRATIAALDGRSRARLDVGVLGAHVDDVVKAAVKLRDRLMKQTGAEPGSLEIAVAGAPGVVDRAGRIRLAHSIRGLEGHLLAERLSTALGCPALVENDVNLAALAEQRAGAGLGVDDFAFLAVGTGTGAGLVLRGELHRGFSGSAGEVDYAVESEPGGEMPGSPHDPCAPVLIALADRWIKAEFLLAENASNGAASNDTASPTTLTMPTTPEKIFGAARAGDPLALRLVAEEARRIAVYAAPIAAVADVELIVLGGGIGLNGDLLLEPLRAELARRVPYPPRLECSALGDHAVLDGAVALGVRTALESVVARRLARRK